MNIRPGQAGRPRPRQTNKPGSASFFAFAVKGEGWLQAEDGQLKSLTSFARCTADMPLTDCLNTIRDKNCGDLRIRRELESQESRLQNLRQAPTKVRSFKTSPSPPSRKCNNKKKDCVSGTTHRGHYGGKIFQVPIRRQKDNKHTQKKRIPR